MSKSMSKEFIRDFNNQIIGTIETKPNGDQVLRNFSQRILGYYFKGENRTRDFNRQIISQGNTLLGLLYRK